MDWGKCALVVVSLAIQPEKRHKIMKTEKEFIKAMKPQLLKVARAEFNSPTLTAIKVHGWNGNTYEKITFVATCNYSILGQKRKDIYSCTYDGQINID